MRLTLIAVVSTVAGTAAADAAESPGHLRLVCTFDKSLHASQGAANPFSAAGGVTVQQAPGRGGVAAFAGHEPTQAGPRRSWEKSALTFDGKNVPTVRGTVALKVRWTGKRHWSDGKRTWLAVLVPRVGEGGGPGEKGTALVLFKEKDNTLALGVYQADNVRMRTDGRSRKSGLDVAEPDAVALRVPVAAQPRDGWATVRLAWDQTAGRVWLGVGERVHSAKASLEQCPWLCLLLGSPPNVQFNKELGFDGQMDDLVVDARTPADAPDVGLAPPKSLPPAAEPTGGWAPAVHLTADAWCAKMESALRTHLRRVLEAQTGGGWAYSVAFPSMMRYLSSKVVIPYTDEYVACSKEQNTAGAACRVLAAYEVLGDQALLAAAERTARLMLELQGPKGNWFYGARVAPKTQKVKWVYNPDLAPFEDHVQSHPTFLMWRLHQVTGKEEYARAAERGVAFILAGQNPNGSWSHHYTLSKGYGQAARGHKHAGEINDYTTSDQMRVLLVAYRRTGDPKHLAGYLRAADWLVSAFIDGKAKGWAQQYDANNKPIRARHFEPPAVSLSEGVNSVPPALIEAWRLTGDAKYRAPLAKWATWMRARHEVSQAHKSSGWHAYYEIDTGRAIRMSRGKIMPADPRNLREGPWPGLLKQVERMDTPPVRHKPSPSAATKALAAGRRSMDFFVTNLDPLVGSWPFNHGPHGTCFSPQTVRVLFLCWGVFTARQLAGQIPWDHHLGTLGYADWPDISQHLVPPAELFKPFSKEEIARARALVRR